MSTASLPGSGVPSLREETRVTRAAAKARARRDRRQGVGPSGRIASAGRPARSALARAPFVVALIIVLAVGVGGVLYLNTKTDESGMRTEQAKAAVAQMRLTVEDLTRQVADLSATPRLAEEAQALGMVPVGDAAIMTIAANGSSTLIETPTKIAAPRGGSHQ